jgi:hypothetical protein
LRLRIAFHALTGGALEIDLEKSMQLDDYLAIQKTAIHKKFLYQSSRFERSNLCIAMLSGIADNALFHLF